MPSFYWVGIDRVSLDLYGRGLGRVVSFPFLFYWVSRLPNWTLGPRGKGC